MQLGSCKEVPRGDEKEGWTFAYFAKKGVDSVRLQRGLCTFGKHKGKPAGDELVVYSWDQARVLREVPRDPVP